MISWLVARAVGAFLNIDRAGAAIGFFKTEMLVLQHPDNLRPGQKHRTVAVDVVLLRAIVVINIIVRVAGSDAGSGDAAVGGNPAGDSVPSSQRDRTIRV